MKILERGEVTMWNMTATCTGNGKRTANFPKTGCKSLLQLERSDLRIYKNPPVYDRISFDVTAVMFKCPVCDCLTDLTDTQVNNVKDIFGLVPFSIAWAKGTETPPAECANLKDIFSGDP